MPKLSLTSAAVLTMGLCFAQSGAYAQTAEDAPPPVTGPEDAAEPEGLVDLSAEDIDPGAGGIIKPPLDEGAEMPPDEGAEMSVTRQR